MEEGRIACKTSKNYINNLFIFLFTLLITGLMIAPFNFVKASTTGISPPVINATGILQGTTQSKTIKVFTGDPHPDSDTVFNVQVRGDYADYISGPDQVIVPPGESNAVYTFDINAPEEVAGEYQVYIDFLLDESAGQDQTEGSTAVKVITGATAVINFSMSAEEMLEYSLTDFQVTDTEIGNPLYVNYVVDNTGNVGWKPDKLEITATDNIDTTNVKTIEMEGDDMPLAKAGTTERVDLEIDHDLIEGSYTATGKFYYQGEVVAELSSQKFRVYAMGTLAQKGELIKVQSNKIEYETGEKIKVEATFKNTGEVPVKTVMITEILKEDGSLVDLLRSDETTISRGSESVLTQIIDKVLDPGKYTLSSYVEYGTQKTPAEQVEIEIKSSSIINNSVTQFIIIIILVVIIIIIAVIYKKKKKDKKIKK